MNPVTITSTSSLFAFLCVHVYTSDHYAFDHLIQVCNEKKLKHEVIIVCTFIILSFVIHEHRELELKHHALAREP